MNETAKKIIMVITCASFFMAGSAMAQNAKENLINKWGTPVNAIQMEDGSEKLVFGPKDSVIGYMYFVVNNNSVVSRGTTDDAQIAKKATSTGPVASGFMASYYKNNTIAKSDLIKKYNTPVSEKTFENGVERVVFGPKDSTIGYMSFLLKDGNVISAGTTDSADKSMVVAAKTERKRNSLTAKYYASKSVTVKDIESNWGAPQKIEKLENGVEKRVYGPKDSMIGYQYFLSLDGKVVDRGVTDSI